MAYTIQKGDTLSKIAKANGTTVDALAAANGIKNVNRIQAGGKLTIPGSTSNGVTLGNPSDGVSLEPGAQADAAGAAPAQAAANQALSDRYIAQLQSLLSAPAYNAGAGYSAAGNNYQSQMNAIKEQYQQMAAQQEAAARAEAEQNRRQAYVNGRLSANRNNEQVASLGLGGNLYADPMSGYSETSRIAADNNMRTNINQVTLAEQNAINQIALKLMEQNAGLDMQTAQYLGSLELARLQAEQNAYQNNISNQLSVIGQLMGYDQFNRQQGFTEEMQRAQLAIDQAQLALQQQAAQRRGSGSRSSRNALLIGDGLFGVDGYGVTPAGIKKPLTSGIEKSGFTSMAGTGTTANKPITSNNMFGIATNIINSNNPFYNAEAGIMGKVVDSTKLKK